MEKKLSKKTLTKSFHNWYYGNLTCFSQEHMQTFGYLCSMLPVVEELYDKKEDQARSMKTSTWYCYCWDDSWVRRSTCQRNRRC